MTEFPTFDGVFTAPFTADLLRLFAPPAYTITTKFAEPRPCSECGEPVAAIEYGDVTIHEVIETAGGSVTTFDTTMTAKTAHAQPCGCRLYAANLRAPDLPDSSNEGNGQ